MKYPLQLQLLLLTALISISTALSHYIANHSLIKSTINFEHLSSLYSTTQSLVSQSRLPLNLNIMSTDANTANTANTNTNSNSPTSTPVQDTDSEIEAVFHDTVERRTTNSTPPSVASDENSVASQLLPINLVPTPSTMSTINIGGMLIAVESTEQVRTTTGALYTKAIRETYDDDKKGKLDLLKLVQSKQQQPYVAISISVNDPEKLLNHYSLSKLNKECSRNLNKYDLLGPFSNIVFPTSPGSGHLLTDSSGNYITHDLFSNTLRVTAQQVAESSRWYSGFTAPSARFQEDLEWSLAYFENNVDSSLYARIHAKLLTYDERSRGGPLFFKLLNDETTTTSESNKKALITIVDTYKVRVSCKGERIPDVVDLFRAITDTVYALCDDSLPEEYVDKLIVIFTTTSVPTFNDLFEELKRQVFAAQLQATLADSLIVPTGESSSLLNDLKGANYVLNYAGKAYYTLSQRGHWDKCLQQPAGDPAIHMNPNGDTVTPPPSGIRCFNCDGPHHLQKCDKPRDQARITKNRNALRDSQSRQPTGFRGQGRPFTRPFKWRLPEEGELNKRIIDSKPYTFNPISTRWEQDAAPPSGGVPLANVIPPVTPPVLPTLSTPPPVPPSPDLKGAMFNQYGSIPSADKEAQKRHLALQMVQLKTMYESL